MSHVQGDETEADSLQQQRGDISCVGKGDEITALLCR